MGRLIKALFALFGILILIILLSGFVPELAATFERFNVGDNGDISSNRFTLWAIAMEGFKSRPIFGIGWYGYRLLYSRYIAAGQEILDAHNVYIQMLCENGIIGLICYLIIVIYILSKTIGLIKKVSNLNHTYHYYSLYLYVFRHFSYLTV